jgi:hypothetical protein
MTLVETGVETYTRRKNVEQTPTALAFTLDPDVEHPRHTASVVRWTDPVRQLLLDLDRSVAERKPRQSLPVESLRGRLEVVDPDNERLDRDLGRRQDPLLVTACHPEDARTRVHEALRGWLVNDVLAENAEEAALVRRLQQLARDSQAVQAEWRTPDVFAWQATLNGTASPATGNPNGYADLADFVARRFQGQEVLPGVGGLRRIASRELTQNEAELMTLPIPIGKTAFSIVVRIRVLTFPGRPTPVVVLDLSRRVWVRALRPSYLVTRLTGYAFPVARSTAMPFTLELTKREDEGTIGWSYEPAADLNPIVRSFDLPMGLKGDDLLAKGPQFSACPLFVVHKNGLGDRAPAKQGIPDRDKLDVFLCATTLLAAAGLRPWQGLAEVQSDTRPIKDRGQWWRDTEKHAVRVQEEVAALAACYEDGTHSFILAFDPHYHADAVLAQSTLDRLLGDRVRVQLLALPPEVHGPRALLPETKRKNADRAEARGRAWQPFLAEARRYLEEARARLDGVLVLAPQFYERRPDDRINKRVGRTTLIRQLRVPVQYLRPIEDAWPPLHGEETPTGRFEQRLLIAWSDLAWKTIGRVKDVALRNAAEEIYRGTPDVAPPDRVLAVGVLRRNATRTLWNEGSFVPFAIELDTARGTCEARVARERGSTVETTARLPLPEALALLAESGPIQLSTDRTARRDQRRERAVRFFHTVITEFCQRAERPLVLIDAVACRDVWPWVADSRIDPSNIVLGDHPHAEADWGDVRIVRVRMANAPKVLWNAEVTGAGMQTGDTISYPDPDAAEAELFRVTDAKMPVYLSFGSLLQTRMIGGVSSYRSIVRLKPSRSGPKTHTLAEEGPWTHAWSTPLGVELAVVRTAAGESPDRLAQYVEQLRILFGHVGGWTSKPAPLFFENALREYVADYALDDDAGDLEDEAADDEEATEPA